MKKIFISLVFAVAMIFTAQAQTVNFIQKTGISFQGYARNSAGAALSGKEIVAKFSVYENGKPPVYVQEVNHTTDAFGVFSSVIGEGGSNLTGSVEDLKFSTKTYKLKVEVKPTGGTYVAISDQFLKAVPYAKAAGNGAPVGAMMPFAGPVGNVPDGWLLCDGASVSKDEYPELFAAIGTAWGSSGSNFRLPDTRGFFLRGVDHGAGRDENRSGRSVSFSGGNGGDKVGSKQGDMFKSHNHTMDGAGGHSHGFNRPLYEDDKSFSTSSSGGNTAKFDYSPDNVDIKIQTDYENDHTHYINSAGGSETRPENVNVNYIIRVK